MMQFPVAPPGAMMSISFESEEIILQKLRERLRHMTDEEFTDVLVILPNAGDPNRVVGFANCW
jgi:hypothetical protein